MKADSKTHDIRVRHVDGCAHVIVYQAPVKIPPGETIIAEFEHEDWIVSFSDVMPNWFVADEQKHREPAHCFFVQ